MSKELNDKQIEKLVRESIQKVGRQQDKMLVEQIKGMTREEFDEILGRRKKTAEKPAAASGTRGRAAEVTVPAAGHKFMPIFRMAVAAGIVLLMILGVNRLYLGTVPQNSYATLFDKYYGSGYKAAHQKRTNETFDAGDNVKNAKGYPNTAKIIQDASEQINGHSRRELRQGTKKLENMLKRGNYNKRLEHEIHWYLGLAYLRNGREAKAREELLEVVNLNSPTHSAQAKELLQELKKK